MKVLAVNLLFVVSANVGLEEPGLEEEIFQGCLLIEFDYIIYFNQFEHRGTNAPPLIFKIGLKSLFHIESE